MKNFVIAVLKALVLKSVTMGEEVSKIIKNCVTSFMDDPLGGFSRIVVLKIG